MYEFIHIQNVYSLEIVYPSHFYSLLFAQFLLLSLSSISRSDTITKQPKKMNKFSAPHTQYEIWDWLRNRLRCQNIYIWCATCNSLYLSVPAYSNNNNMHEKICGELIKSCVNRFSLLLLLLLLLYFQTLRIFVVCWWWRLRCWVRITKIKFCVNAISERIMCVCICEQSIVHISNLIPTWHTLSLVRSIFQCVNKNQCLMKRQKSVPIFTTLHAHTFLRNVHCCFDFFPFFFFSFHFTSPHHHIGLSFYVRFHMMCRANFIHHSCCNGFLYLSLGKKSKRTQHTHKKNKYDA